MAVRVRVVRILSVYAAFLACGVGGVHAWDAAAVGAPAVRGTQIQITPQPSVRTIVNGLPYKHYDHKPAHEAFRYVATWAGWTPERIEAWLPFVNDVMFGESAYCWNRRNGDVVESYSYCKILRTTQREDVGFGQVTRSYYGSNAKLCQLYGICSAAQILASPFDSMLWSIVRPIELDGSRPWCYNAYARGYHDCWLAPDR